MAEPFSPEDKLLKLIRRKDKSAVLSQQKANDSTQDTGGFLNTDKVLQAFDKVLIVGIIILSVYIGYEFLFTAKDINRVVKEVSAPSKEIKEEDVSFAEPKPYTYYTDVVQTRDIFESPMYGSGVKKPEDIKAVSSLPELTKNLKLVGIVLDGHSQAIIEDAEVNQTFFLHKGEQIKNAVVEDIQEGKVTLLYGSQKIELTP